MKEALKFEEILKFIAGLSSSVLVTLGLLALLSIKRSTQMTSVQLMLHTHCRNKTQVLEKLSFYSNRATSPHVLHWVCNFFLEKS